MGQTYYELLGVDTDATVEAIRAAFRDRIKEAHPDVNNDPTAKFQTAALVEAKDVLTSPARRARYDRLGHTKYVSLSGSTRSRQSRTSTTSSDSSSASTSQSSYSSSSATSTDGSSSRSENETTGSSSNSTASNAESYESSTQSTAAEADSPTGDGNSNSRSSSTQDEQASTTSASSSRTAKERRQGPTTGSKSNNNGFQSSRATATKSGSYELDVGWAAAVAWVARSLAGLGLWFGGLLALYGVTGRELVHTPLALTLLVASFGVSFLGYDVALEYASKNARRASGTPDTLAQDVLWLAAVNLTGVLLFETATSNPITFFITVIVSIGVTAILVGGMIAVLLGFFAGIRGALVGLLLGAILGSLLVFTGWLGQPYEDLVMASGLPWVSPTSVASVQLGILANTLLAGWMLLAIGGSALWFLLRFTVLPWRDRYENGYRVRPGVWQTLLILPVIVTVGVPALGVPTPSAGGIDLWATALSSLMAAPIALGVPYYCRVALERTLRRHR